MKLSKARVALRVNRLARIKAKIATLENLAYSDIAVLKAIGGGESARWRAELVTMPRREMVIPRHKQLRLFDKRKAA